MTKDNYSQTDLFLGSSGEGENKPTSRRPMLSYVRGYEKFIIFILCGMVLSIISFSLGVEKGKRLSVSSAIDQKTAASKKNIQSEEPSVRTLKPVINPTDNFIVKPQDDSSSVVAVKFDTKAQSGERYTIQVASFKTSSLAHREAKELERRGFSTIVSSKGKYVILCVGNFADREEAKTTLSQLKKKYEDCFIRRL